MEASPGTGSTAAGRSPVHFEESMKRYRKTHRTLSVSMHVEELEALRRFVAGPAAIADQATVVDVLRAALEEFDNAERLRAEDEAAEIVLGGRP